MHRSRTKVHRPRSISSISKVGCELDVSTPLTPAPGHLLCLYFVGCEKQVSNLLNNPVMGLLGFRMGGTCANMITRASRANFLQLQVEGGNAAIARICAPTASAKKVCHRLADQDSSRGTIKFYRSVFDRLPVSSILTTIVQILETGCSLAKSEWLIMNETILNSVQFLYVICNCPTCRSYKVLNKSISAAALMLLTMMPTKPSVQGKIMPVKCSHYAQARVQVCS